MPLKTIVKVSHVSNLSDARYCAGMGVEMLGFRVVPGAEYYIAPEVFQEIRGWISGPRITAELYGLADIAQLDALLQAYAPDYFELTLDQFTAFGSQLNLPCIVHVENRTTLPTVPADEKIIYLLSDESTQCGDIAESRYPVLKKISSLPSLQASTAGGCFAGFALGSPKEIRPGVTNYDELGQILEALDTE